MKNYILICLLSLFNISIFGQTGLKYQYWIDDNETETISGTLSSSKLSLNLDVNELEEGIHAFYIQLQDSSGIWGESAMRNFYKIDIENPLVASNIEYWFDNETEQKKSIDGTSGIYDIDVSELSDGIHYLTLILKSDTGGVLDSKCQFFYKISDKEVGITHYQYSVNFSKEKSHKFKLDTPTNPLSIVSLVTVEECPIRSSCFEFRIEDKKPVLYAKNDISFYFYDTQNRMSQFSARFVDEMVREEVDTTNIEILQPNTTATISRPADNTIKWLKFEAEEGDTIALKSSHATTIQVFSPSGKEIYAASGAESVELDGCHTWETGTYYVAIHDVTAQKCTQLELEYMHMAKHDVVGQDIKTVGNGGYNNITFYGNGFDNLYAVDLYNESGDTISSENIFHKSDATVAVTFYCKQAKLGKYDAIFHFTTEDKCFSDVLLIEQATAIELSTNVSYPTSHLSGSYATYSFTISNEGNMTAYYVPLELKIEVDSIKAIESLKLGGDFNRINNSKELLNDSIDEELIAIYNDVLASTDDLSHFIIVNDSINNVEYGISHVILTIPPYSTKVITATIKLRTFSPITITGYTNKDWYPLVRNNDSYNTLANNETKEWMCCYKERIKCTADLILKPTLTGLINLGISATATPVTAASLKPAVDCAADLGGTALEAVYDIWCSEGETTKEKFSNYIDDNATSLYASLIGDVSGCVIGYFDEAKNILRKERHAAIDAKDYAKADAISKEISSLNSGARNVLSNINDALSDLGGLSDLFSCLSEYTKKIPNCPPNPDGGGGKSLPVSSYDPNDITGYIAESGSRYIGKHVEKVAYMIEFENDSTFATAPAHTILLSDTLDTNAFDITSIEPIKVQIGDKTQKFVSRNDKHFATIDMRPGIDAIAQISMSVDNSGILSCILESLDPMTMETTTEPLNGILPVNDTEGNGTGFVTFNIGLNKNLKDGTEIANMANIIFDANDAISTPYWINETDYVNPESCVDSVVCVSDSLVNISFKGFDERSGIWKYDLYVQPGANSDWFLMQEAITTNTCQYEVFKDIDYGFCVVATDMAGNREEKSIESEFRYFNESTTTQINNILIEQDKSNDDSLYDLFGRKVANPSPGIYIRNGEKVIIKQ